MCKTRRICSVCGERRNLYEIPDKNRFDRENALFSALEDETREKFCYLPDDEDEDVYCCVSCFKDLKKRRRLWPLLFPHPARQEGQLHRQGFILHRRLRLRVADGAEFSLRTH
jgi:hypothetical protein